MVVREGTDVTLVTYGATLQRAVTAANAVADEGISVEVIDPRTIKFDDALATIVASIVLYSVLDGLGVIHSINTSIAAGVICFGRRLFSRLNTFRKCFTSAGMSSGRSRSGGT